MPSFQFQPVCSSWVALHPHPKGIIQFIGGAFLGRVPPTYYRWFLRLLFDEGYTIVAFPFRSTFNHWAVALDLLEEHYRLRCALIELSFSISHYTDYDYKIYLDPKNYAWVGHSLGCKYIAILEILTGLSSIELQPLNPILQPNQILSLQLKLREMEYPLQRLSTQLERQTHQSIYFGKPSIFNEPSILIAPVITDLSAAIPFRGVQSWLEGIGIHVLPTVEQTHQLIDHSSAFNLTAIIQFQSDRYAKSTCDRLIQGRSLILENHPGRHLEPIFYDHSNVYQTVLNSLNQLKLRLTAPPTIPALAISH